jgi:glycosyltransferase involved in cell wall biosynthesis
VSAREPAGAERALPAAPGPRPRGLRVVHVITSLEEGGAQAMLHQLLSVRGSAGDDARVVALTGEGPVGARIAALGVPVLALGMRRGRPGLRAALRLVRVLCEARPDVVQTWMYHADLLGGLAAAALGIPVVWGVRHDRLLDGDRRLTRLTRRACGLLSPLVPARVVCNSAAALRTHAEAGYARDKLLVVPNGFDLSRFRPDAEARRATRRALAIPEDAPVVGCVARYHPHKDHATFLAAAAMIREEVGGVRFVLCGAGVDWDNRELVRAIDGAGLRGSVQLLGSRPDVERIMAALDVACLTSRTESFPNVLGEAMACGVPCVATDCGGVRELVGDLGRLVPVGDARAVARASLELLRLDPARRAAAGAAGRARVRSQFALEAVAERFRAVQREACAAGSRRP